MKLELHILQNFAPSCLNRDDTNSPKDCEFGGVRRARISSQCLKRAVREAFEQHQMLDKADIAVRTKRLVKELADRIEKAKGCERDLAVRLAVYVLEGGGLAATDSKDGSEPKTQYLLFLPARQIDRLASLILESWPVLIDGLQATQAAGEPEEPEAAAAPAKGKKKPPTARQKKAEAKAKFPREIGKAVEAILADDHATPELALFGRMIADKPDWNTDAACQVAHAISTNRVTMEFDFYTAVDDLKPDDAAGSDMMGTVQFNSACFYRYALVNLEELEKNLGGQGPAGAAAARDQARRSAEAFIRASVLAIPTGKQNSMAAQNLPGFVLAIVRDGGAPWSLANAFLDPVRYRAGDARGDLMTQSMKRLDEHLGAMARVYGADGIRRIAWCTLDAGAAADLDHLGGGAGSALRELAEGSNRQSLAALIQSVAEAAFAAPAA
ncbi:MAG: type I-E CRISPR-associated protein Cas7/Cse4/CasC [Polyangiaceae bacterium]|nr:type I-E CRISPR-associated protein Cas7/Cse4/CasC [Polyangiaceae bacterium]